MRTPIAKSVERDAFILALRKQMRAERKANSDLPIDTRPKQYQSAMMGHNLKVTQADIDAGRAPAGSLGKFWFVPGYSDPDGDDVIRP